MQAQRKHSKYTCKLPSHASIKFIASVEIWSNDKHISTVPSAASRLACASMVQAFKGMPSELMAKLCKGLELRHVPANGVICEEDAPGDSMFVVMAGTCTVRALPPPPADTTESHARERNTGSVVVSTSANRTAAPRRKRRVQLGPEEQVHAQRIRACLHNDASIHPDPTSATDT